MPHAFFEYYLAGFSFVLGAMIGSFLNVCIYRMPIGLSVNEPRRSFCPLCKAQIPWHQNLPLFSWLALRGKCARCGGGIPFRYFGVELLTAGCFLAIWLRFNVHEWTLVVPYWILMSLLLVATFIDLEHFIIPDEITIGGTVAGVVGAAVFPAMMGTESHLWAPLWSAAGGALGFGLLFAVVELGKKAFGRTRQRFDPPELFRWVRRGEEADLTLGGESMLWSELFARDSDRMMVSGADLKIDGKAVAGETATFSYNRVVIGAEERELDGLDEFSARVSEIVIPREAMGFGDVKFIAAIGAFLGWEAVLFTIVVASVVGAIVGSLGILLGKREASGRIPFGPYLALGAVVWMFAGGAILDWYWNFANLRR